MQKRVAVAVLATTVIAAVGAVLASERELKPSIAPVQNELYAKECGACHLAYPPGLLPARSWQKLMGSLADHFGENADLAPEDAKALADYLASHAADRTGSGLSARIARSLAPEQTPLRISEVPYIAREHRELPGRLVTGNPQVKSLSRCDACHTHAASASFNEHDIRIPGVGRWED